MIPTALLALALLAPQPAAADRVAIALASAPAGTRAGLLVVDDRGREIVSIRADERFVPASTAKLFTTAAAAAFALLDTNGPDKGGASVRLEGADVVLTGHGDARLSSASDCAADCLVDLARAVARRTRTVRDVIGDDSWFPDERWPVGMSWNNMAWRSGTATSALTIDDNEVAVVITGRAAGAAPAIAADGYFTIDNHAATVAAGTPAALLLYRTPGSMTLRLAGTIAAGASETVRAGLDDPAHRAAWRFASLLRAAGVRVTGIIAARHRAPDDAIRMAEPIALARLDPPPLGEDIRATNKASLNLHAELLLRRLGAARGTGSVAEGLAAVQEVLDRAGVPRAAYDLADGSGMSSYDRVTPRAMVRLLTWAAGQSWGAAWRDTLPMGGVDGTLARRFRGTPLEGRIAAKTGTLYAASGIAGYFTAASGRRLTFAAFAADMPGDANATAALDTALLAVAAAN